MDRDPDDTTPPITIDLDGNRAHLVYGGPRRTAASLLRDLELGEPRPVLLVVGGAADSMDAAADHDLRQMLGQGAIRAVAAVGGAIVDGGTNSGVMAAVGAAAAAGDVSVVLVGVAPAGKVSWPNDDRVLAGEATQLEPNHTHFVLAKSDAWGGELSLLFDVVDTLGRGRRAAVVLAGGGTHAIDEVRAAAERSLPIVVLTGTGGLADRLKSHHPPAAGHAPDRPDPIAEIVEDADLRFVPVRGDPTDLERSLARLLGVDETLRDAWRQHDIVSAAAGRERRQFLVVQSTVLLLGVALTTIVVTKSVLDRAGALAGSPTLEGLLHLVILLIPLTIATVAAAASRMRPGNRWVLLRGTSESIKREIFRYRARAGIYRRSHTRSVTREAKLAQNVSSAMRALMRTDVNLMSLDLRNGRVGNALSAPATTPGPPDDPDRLSTLSAAEYVRGRIDHQIEWYQRAVARLARRARVMRWLALVFGALGTFLAAVGFEIWVAVTTAIAGAVLAYIQSWQLDTAIVLYNQAGTELGSIRSWWVAQSPADQARPATTDRLVEGAERILSVEHINWVQEMQDAMTRVRLEQGQENEPDDGPSPGEKDAGPRPGHPADYHDAPAASRRS